MFKKKADKNLGAAVDIWALGVTMYYMLTGQHPHQSATDLQLLQHHITSVEINFDRIKHEKAREIVSKMLKIKESERASL